MTQFPTSSGTSGLLSISNPYLPNSGPEAKVVSIALNTAINKESEVIEGQNGAYKIKVINVSKAPELPDYTSYLIKEKSKRQDVSGIIFTSLKEKAEIKDNRHLFY